MRQNYNNNNGGGGGGDYLPWLLLLVAGAIFAYMSGWITLPGPSGPGGPVATPTLYIQVSEPNPPPMSTPHIIVVTSAPEPVVIPTITQVIPTLIPTEAPAIAPTPTGFLRPITPEEFELCKADPNVNPACADYLRVNGGG